MPIVDWARETAEQHLATALPTRWQHIQGVAAQANRLSTALDLSPMQADCLVAAAYLHDIGYSPDLAKTGFHPLDGARYLREQGIDQRLCSLVAFHTAAIIEAQLRGCADDVQAEFQPEESAVSDALWYCDLTTSPTGEMSTVEGRLAEIQQRYGPGHIVTRFIDIARDDLFAAVRRTEQRMHCVVD